MKKAVFHSLLILSGLVLWAGITGARADDITKAPENPDDVERLRVWIPIEKDVRHRVNVQIMGHQGKPLRTLFEGTLGKGYHNFYWDKKDDSGHYVDAGKYAVLISAGRNARYETLEVVYGPWETTAHVTVQDSENIDTAVVSLDEDSARVSLLMASATGDTVLVLARDTLLPAGRYEYPIIPPPVVAGGAYDMLLFINGMLIKKVDFRYRP